ncbi:Uu.00g043030.m01.CDS01 [Anthostomella pinea]|uniref:acylphosphatase n=1 Tax=Anthostomella pinea TaxID=933095 RepID=A0AAI8YE60_9PEZI|nr:Uu.00g043030.m01.CDS01 [Anthostomella pinea]
MAQRIYFLVHGQVQGVSFRYFTQKKAAEHSITGWCRNTDNEKVEGEAQGEDSAMKEFLKAINQGPSAAKVMKLDQEARDVKDGESRFEVR